MSDTMTDQGAPADADTTDSNAAPKLGPPAAGGDGDDGAPAAGGGGGDGGDAAGNGGGDGGGGAGGDHGGGAGGGKDGKSLTEQRDELRAKKQQQSVEQVDATLAELGKVLADQEKALAEYTPEVMAEFTAVQEALEHKFGHLKTQLENDVGAAKEWVNKVVADRNAALAAARADVDAELDTPIYQATRALAQAVKDRDAAAARLARWRKPVDAIKARQKAAGDLLKEITALATPETHKHGEAYWKLGLDGTEPVAGQPYLKALVEGPPAVVQAADLPGKILAAWNAFQEKRQAAETAALALAAAQARVKMATETVAQLEKTLIPSIAEILGDWEDHKAP